MKFQNSKCLFPVKFRLFQSNFCSESEKSVVKVNSFWLKLEDKFPLWCWVCSGFCQEHKLSTEKFVLSENKCCQKGCQNTASSPVSERPRSRRVGQVWLWDPQFSVQGSAAWGEQLERPPAWRPWDRGMGTRCVPAAAPEQPSPDVPRLPCDRGVPHRPTGCHKVLTGE